MRSTLELSDSVVEQARKLSGIARITDLVREGLKALIERETRKRLIAYGGTDAAASSGPRQRPGEMVADTHDQ